MDEDGRDSTCRDDGGGPVACASDARGRAGRPRSRRKAGSAAHLFCGALALLVGMLAATARAQGEDAYPSRPLTLIVPFAPGGGNDIMARLVGERMSRSLGQQVVVENRPGAGGNIGSRQAARSAPDGYTMLLAFTGTMAINPSLYVNLNYDPEKELTPIGSIATSSAVLVVHPSLPVTTLKELIAHAKANPGALDYASSGVGTVVNIATEMVAEAAGISVKQIPYRGTGPAISDLVGGHIRMMMPPIPAILSQIQAGTVRALAVTSAERSALLPAVPTMSEAGLAGFVSVQRYGLLVPAATPRPIVERLNKELRAALADDTIRRRIIDDGAAPAPDSPENYAAEMARERKSWGGIVRKLGLRVE